jgi:hypothetical protein
VALKRKQDNASQAEFDWSQPAPQPPVIAQKPPLEQPGRKLDADGHQWVAALCNNAQEHCISEARRDQEHAQEYAQIAKVWKDQATRHQALCFCMREKE